MSPFIGYPAEVRLRLRPSGQVRSDVPLDYCHLDLASCGYSRIVRQIGRVGHLPLARRHLCVSAKRQSDEHRRKRSSGTESLRTRRWREADRTIGPAKAATAALICCSREFPRCHLSRLSGAEGLSRPFEQLAQGFDQHPDHGTFDLGRRRTCPRPAPFSPIGAAET